MFLLLALILLPFRIYSPGVSKDQKIIKETLQPGTRRFTVMLPDGYDEIRAYPLIIGLHYGGHGLPFYGELFLKNLVEPAFHSLRAIIVAPDCPSKDWTQAESERFIDDLIQYLLEQYNIDSDRVLFIGYSMGGNGVWHLGSKFPGAFSEAVIMAAKPPKYINHNVWQKPVFIIHGKKDELFPVVDTTRTVLGLENGGVDITYRILEDVSHFETQKFQSVLQDAKTWVLNRWSVIK